MLKPGGGVHRKHRRLVSSEQQFNQYQDLQGPCFLLFGLQSLAVLSSLHSANLESLISLKQVEDQTYCDCDLDNSVFELSYSLSESYWMFSASFILQDLQILHWSSTVQLNYSTSWAKTAFFVSA